MVAGVPGASGLSVLKHVGTASRAGTGCVTPQPQTLVVHSVRATAYKTDIVQGSVQVSSSCFFKFKDISE